MFQVCTEKIPVYRIYLLKVQKTGSCTLLSGYDIYPIQTGRGSRDAVMAERKSRN